MTATFDVEQFASTTIEEASSTEYVPVPDAEYNAVVKSHKILGPKNEGQSPIFKVMWQLDCPENEDAHDKIVPQTVWLDISEQGALLTGKGKNVQLGRLREALDQNTPGQPWTFAMVDGQVGRVQTKQRVNDDTGEIFSDVVAVTKLA